MGIRKMRKLVKYFLIVAGVVACAFNGRNYFPSIKGFESLSHAATPSGFNPSSPVVSLPDGILPIDNMDRPEQLLYRRSYLVSYNSYTKCPNWVLWELTREHADGDVKRPDYAFHEDLEVPAPRAELTDYRGSGYDRGHMCPAGDNKWDEDAMYDTFLMTNMCPQNKNLNAGLWNQIEMQCRYWAKKYGNIYIVCGPVFFKGEHKTIGANKVFVPDAFFKVVFCLQDSPKGIGFICRNTDGNRKKDYYLNTIKDVERITGYTFFPDMDDDIAESVKSHAALDEW